MRRFRFPAIPDDRNERLALLALAAVTLLALFLRVYRVTSSPPGFFADEASFGLNADLILRTGKDEFGEFLPIFFRAFGEYKLPFYIYSEVPFMAVFGRTELAVRATSAVIGSLTVITSFLLAKELFRHNGPALAAAGLLAVMPWHIHYSRTGLGDSLSFLLVVTLALYLALRALRTGSTLTPAAIAFGVSLYTYRAGWIVLPPMLLVVGIAYWDNLWARRRELLKFPGIFALFLIPIARHLLSDNGDRTSQAWIFNIESETSTLQIFWEFYRSYFTLDFLVREGDAGPITRHYFPGHGMVYAFMLPLFVLGLVYTVVKHDRASALIIVFVLIFPLSGAVSDTSPHSNRTLFGAVALSLLGGAGVAMITELFRSVSDWSRRYAVGAVAAVIIVFAAFSTSSYFTAYLDDYPRLSAGYWGWQDGPQEILGRFNAMQDEYDEMYMDGTFNAPNIFIPFYTHEDCPKCFIGAEDRYKPNVRQLFALRPETLKPAAFDYEMKDQIYYPDGTVAFVFVEIRGQR